MATRMQQRRGTAAQWTAANPTLAAGEIGFETDNNRFKIGDGVNNWVTLDYFANSAELAALLDGAPDALNTLNELAAAINDDPAFFSTVSEGIAVVSSALSDHTGETTGVHGIADTSLLATQEDAESLANAAASSAVSTHNSDTENVHGIADTALLATQEYADSAANAAASSAVTDAITTHSNDTTSVHGIEDTANLATKGYADSAAGTAVTSHNNETTDVHGIADTALLALKSEVSAVTATSLGLGNVTNTSDADKPVSTAQASAIATAKTEAIADATAQVTAVLDGAPGALDTLNELAAALGDDPDFAGTITTSLGLKVDSLTPISQKSTSYTLSSLTERDDLIEMDSTSAMTLTIPTDATLNFPIGTSLDILQTNTGQVTVAAAVGVTVNATPGLKLRTRWSSATLMKRAANTWVVYGDLTA